MYLFNFGFTQRVKMCGRKNYLLIAMTMVLARMPLKFSSLMTCSNHFA